MLICLQLKIQYNSNKLAKLWNKLCERPCVRRGDRFPTAARRKCPFRRHASLAPRHRRINTAGLKIILFFSHRASDADRFCGAMASRTSAPIIYTSHRSYGDSGVDGTNNACRKPVLFCGHPVRACCCCCCCWVLDLPFKQPLWSQMLPQGGDTTVILFL